MHYKTNRVNHDFQIAYFLAGSCHTADAAYGLLCDLREDRSNALKSYEAGKLREEAKRLRAERMLKSEDEVVRLEGAADLAELEAFRETTARNVAAAQAELRTIESCIESLQPLRKYKHLSDPEAFEAAQAEEWKLELIHRAENSLLTMGTIPTDHFATMRMHPDFQSEILPAINQMRHLLTQPEGASQILNRHKEKPVFHLPTLLKLGQRK